MARVTLIVNKEDVAPEHHALFDTLARIMEERHTERAPSDVLGGQYSLPFTTAVTLTRDMADPLVYDDDAIRDLLVRDLARRIELEPIGGAEHETPGFWPADVMVDVDGQHHVLHARPHKGSPRNPFTWPEACEKFCRYTASMLEARRATAIVDAVGRLEEATDMAGIARLAS